MIFADIYEIDIFLNVFARFKVQVTGPLQVALHIVLIISLYCGATFNQYH